MVGQVVSHYRIVSRLGAGGMGVVYEAEDTRLHRRVAVKFLPEPFSRNDQALSRFHREAQAASALNHPNICSVFDIGEHDGRQFLVMELLEGETLRERLGRGALPTEQLLDVAAALADALGAAHAKGIVHRDVKPANVFLTAFGVTKVLDFGLAKRDAVPEGVDDDRTHAVEADLTGLGTAIGTVAYMSPEQARGEAVDRRTDIFSLGAVLYEMATGRQAFGGTSTAVSFDSILNRPLPDPTTENAALPVGFDAIVRRATEKSAELRYQTAADLRSDLRRLQRDTSAASVADASRAIPVAAGSGPVPTSGRAWWRRPWVVGGGVVATLALAAVLVATPGPWRPGGRPPIRSIAVLPFENTDGDPEAEYLGDGIAENLINALSNVPQLRVIPRGVAFVYKGQSVDPRVLGEELDVQAVITGRVTSRGEGLVIGAELTDVESVSQLWGQQYTREMPDMEDLQAEITSDILRNLRMELAGSEPPRGPPGRAGRGPGRDPESMRLVMRGRFHLNQQSPAHLRRARAFFQEALAIDNENARAYAGLSYAHTLLGMFGDAPPDDTYPRAEAAALNALRLDDDLVEAHLALGIVRALWEWDLEAAEAEVEAALRLDPDHGEAHMMSAHMLNGRGDVAGALAAARRAVELDPLSPQSNHVLGTVLIRDGRHREAIDQLETAIELAPDLPRTREALVRAHLGVGDVEAARAVAREGTEGPRREALEAYVEARAGEPDRARTVLPELEAAAEDDPPLAVSLALLLLELDEPDRALDWLERAVERREPAAMEYNLFGDFDALAGDPRFVEIMAPIWQPDR